MEEDNEKIKEEATQEETLRLVEKITTFNKKIDDNYDEILKRLDDKKKMTPDEKEAEEKNEKIELLNEKLRELKDKISQARKQGKDPLIADLMIRNVKAKIKMAEVTNTPEDFIRVENILKNANKELDEALKTEELNIKKEIEEKLKEELKKDAEKIETNDDVESGKT